MNRKMIVYLVLMSLVLTAIVSVDAGKGDSRGPGPSGSDDTGNSGSNVESGKDDVGNPHNMEKDCLDCHIASLHEDCDDCHGSRKSIHSECEDCHGANRNIHNECQYCHDGKEIHHNKDILDEYSCINPFCHKGSPAPTERSCIVCHSRYSGIHQENCGACHGTSLHKNCDDCHGSHHDDNPGKGPGGEHSGECRICH